MTFILALLFQFAFAADQNSILGSWRLKVMECENGTVKGVELDAQKLKNGDGNQIVQYTTKKMYGVVRTAFFVEKDKFCETKFVDEITIDEKKGEVVTSKTAGTKRTINGEKLPSCDGPFVNAQVRTKIYKVTKDQLTTLADYTWNPNRTTIEDAKHTAVKPCDGGRVKRVWERISDDEFKKLHGPIN